MMKFAQLSFALAVAVESTDKMYTTDSGDCIFPFTYKGQEYNRCTTDDAYGKRSWCSTKVNEKGEYIAGEWDTCEPNSDLECKDYDFPKDCVSAKSFRNCRWNTWDEACVDCDTYPEDKACRDTLRR